MHVNYYYRNFGVKVVEKINIKKATIFGFGKWVDYTMTFSTDTFNCIYGYNESGKSTLKQFILFMLFGFPPKKRQFYRPKTSGKMGGRLIVEDDVYGIYTIERLDEVKNGAATCYLSDGQIKGDNWLMERLQGMRASSYEAVYLFSALELHHIKAMKHTDLGDVLLGIGLTGAHNIYDIEKQLDQEIGRLFKPSGTRPLMNQLLETLDDTQTALTKSQKQQATYQERDMAISRMESDLKSLQETVKQEQETYDKIQKQREHYTLIMEYHQFKRKHENMLDEVPFPENGIKRLERINEQRLPLQSEYDVLTTNFQKNTQKCEQLKSEQLESKLLQSVQTLGTHINDYVNNKKTYQTLKDECQKLQNTLEREISELNIQLNPETLSHMTLPFYTERNWKDIESEMTHILYERDQLEQTQQESNQHKETLENEIRTVKEHLLTDDARASLQQTVQVYETRTLKIQLHAQRDKQHEQWHQQKSKIQKKKRIILVGTLMFAFLSALVGWFLNESVLFGVMTGIIVLGYMLWRTENQMIKQTTAWIEAQDVSPPTDHMSEAEYVRSEKLLREDERYRNERSALEKQLKTHHIHHLQWEEKSRLIEQRADRLNKRIQSEADTYPFLQHIQPTHWPELYHKLKRLLTLQQDITNKSERKAQLKERCTSFESQVRSVLGQIDPAFAEQSTSSQIEKLQLIQTEQHDKAQYILQLNQARTEMLESQKMVLEKRAVYDREKQMLLAAANVKDDDAFYQMARKKETFENNKVSFERISDQLETLLPQDICEQVKISPPNERELNLLLKVSKQHIQEGEQALERKRQQLADAKATLKQLESSDTYSQLNHRFMQEKEELQQLAREWLVQKVAKEMLARAKQAYQEKYLTTALEKTSDYFKRVTDNAYIAVYGPTKAQPFQVEAADHSRFSVNELSQGTVDQLYVCLRLAIGEVMSQKHHLPFIIDDAFVHFDFKRTKRMIHILKQVSTKRQVILLTCKRDVVEALPRELVRILESPSRQLL